MRKLLPLCLLLASATAFGGQAATTSTATSLYAAPEGKALSSLAKGVVLDVGDRSGGWYPVTLVDGRKGWVKMSAVRFKEEAQGEGVFGGLWSWLNSGTRRSSSGTTTAGIRGMSAEDIQNVTPRADQVDQLAQFQVDAATARKFASQGGLKTHTVDELEE